MVLYRFVSIMYANRAAAHMELEDFDTAIEDCINALDQDSTNQKAKERLERARVS